MWPPDTRLERQRQHRTVPGGGLRQTQRYRSLGLFPPPKSLGKSYDGHAVSSRLRHRLRSALIRMFGKLFHLLLLMAPELRLAPLHALHDTSLCYHIAIAAQGLVSFPDPNLSRGKGSGDISLVPRPHPLVDIGAFSWSCAPSRDRTCANRNPVQIIT